MRLRTCHKGRPRQRAPPTSKSSPLDADPPRPEPPTDGPEVPALDRALDLVRFLRAECPWDARQTPRSLVPHLLEESHEVVDAIEEGDADALEGELGDLLLNLAFQVVIGEEEGRFTADSVTRRIEEKMRRRHPHLYGLGEKEPWEVLKSRERRGSSGERGVLDGIARALDPLTKAHRIQEKVSGVGFDWEDWRGAWEKVAEELDEVRAVLEATEPGDGGSGAAEEAVGAVAPATAEEADDTLEEELGDLLFAAVNLVRLAGRHPTTALGRANRKFRDRFRRLEALALERGIELGDVGLEELDALWDELKASEGEE